MMDIEVVSLHDLKNLYIYIYTQVRKDLQKSYAFQDYPSVFQTALCRVAWYQ